MADKNTEDVKLHLPPGLELELRRLADADSRKLSDFIRLVLSRYVYGNRATPSEESEGANRREKGRTGEDDPE